MWTLWSVFLSVTLAGLVASAVVDLVNLRFSGEQITVSAQAVYMVSSFMFWLLCGLSGALTLYVLPGIGKLEAHEHPLVWVGAMEGASSGLTAHNLAQAGQVDQLDVVLADLNEARFGKAREQAADSSELEAQIAAQFFTAHAQYRFC